MQGSQETEEFGKSVLLYQLISGLWQEIELKLAGIERSFEQLLTRAHFEAKHRELGGSTELP